MKPDVAQREQPPTPENAAVQSQMERILSAPEFTTSKMMRAFLTFAVNETLEGRSDRIKQYTIATKVFDRDSDFNQQTDPVVRVQASKLRRSLQRYYYEEGRTDPIRIEIPKGTYVPRFSLQEQAAAKAERPARVIQSRPTIAVLPFENRCGDSTQDYMAAGFAEDLSAELSRFSNVSVIAFYTTQQCAGHEQDVFDRGRELNADYLVTGSIRQCDPNLRVNVQVDCTRSGETVWAERFRRSRSASDLFEIQDKIIQNVVAQVAAFNGAIHQAMAKSTRRKEAASLSGYEAVLRAIHYDKTHHPEHFRDALNALENAVQSEPDFAPAMAWLATLYLDSAALGCDAIENATETGIEYAERAVAIDPNSQDAHFAMAWACLQQGDRRGATSSAWKMVELNPGDAFFVGSGGWFLALSGDRAKGMEIIEQSRELNPRCPTWFHFIPCLDYFDRGDYESAFHEAGLMGVPDLFWEPLIKASALAHLDRIEEAAQQLHRLLGMNRAFAARPDFYVRCLVLPEELRRRILLGLEIAGLGKATATN